MKGIKVISTDFDFKVPTELTRLGMDAIINVSASTKVSSDKVVYVDVKMTLVDTNLATINDTVEVNRRIIAEAERRLQDKLNQEITTAEEVIGEGWLAELHKAVGSAA